MLELHGLLVLVQVWEGPEAALAVAVPCRSAMSLGAASAQPSPRAKDGMIRQDTDGSRRRTRCKPGNGCPCNGAPRHVVSGETTPPRPGDT